MRGSGSKAYLGGAGLALVLAAVAAGAASGPRARATGPNLLLITIDTLRADRVGIYEPSRALTPEIDRFAAGAAVFTRAFAHTPTTLPSHVNILTGTTPSYHGVHDNANFVVRGDILTLSEHLKSAGYVTGAFVGGFPLDSRFGLSQGFDVYDDRFTEPRESGLEPGRERRAQAVVDSALAWLRGRSSPWFLWIHCYDPHDPYSPPEPFRTTYARNLYDGEVAYTDSVLGRLFRHLDDKGLLPSTLVVFTGDHGESLGDHGETTHGFLAYNATLWIPLIIRLPGGAPHVIRRNVAHIDIFPTVCEALGLKIPPFIQGRSLLPLIKGKSLGERSIFFESLSPFYNMGWAPLTGYVNKSDKFTDSPFPELFDLDKDFGERENLAATRPLDLFRTELGKIVRLQTSAESAKAGQAADQDTQRKLRSLGYVAGRLGGRAAPSSREFDAKILLPFHNRSMEALDRFHAGQEREGTEALKEIIATGKPVGAAYANLAAIYKIQGRWVDAAAVLKMGLGKAPDIYDLFVQYISCLYESGLFQEALQAFTPDVYPQTKSDPVIWNYVGLSYFKAGNPAKARESYEKSLAIDPNFAIPYNNLGSLLTYQFKASNDPAVYRRAVEYYGKAMALDPSYAAACHGLGVLHFQAKNYDRAVLSLTKALDLDPGLHEAFYFLGVAYLARGEKGPASQALLKYKAGPAYDRLTEAEKARLETYIQKTKF